jgi:ABC-2 type transport system ATP-binding protein
MIRINSISRSFGKLLAVDRFTVNIEAGEIFGLLGPNGAGKSTIISMMSGQLLPSGGELLINGSSPMDLSVKRVLGVSPQSLAMYEELTAIDNLEFFGALYGIKGKKLKNRCLEVLEFVGLSDRANGRVEHFSGGMKRRLNLAITLVHGPDILLLDEPTVGVDPQSRNKLFENVLALKAAGKTILYTTHYMEEAEKLCDRIGVLDKGHLLALGTVDELIREHGGESQVSYTTRAGRITTRSMNPVEEIQQALREHPELSDLGLVRPNLEHVFLNLTGRQMRD